MCDIALAVNSKVLSDIALDKDLTANNLKIIDMEDLVTVTLFHEVRSSETEFSGYLELISK